MHTATKFISLFGKINSYSVSAISVVSPNLNVRLLGRIKISFFIINMPTCTDVRISVPIIITFLLNPPFRNENVPRTSNKLPYSG